MQARMMSAGLVVALSVAACGGGGASSDATTTTTTVASTTTTTVGVFTPIAGQAVPTIAAGQDHALAIKADGSLWAWGNNYEGQLGYTTTATCQDVIDAGSHPCSTAPGQVGTGYSAVAAGNEFSAGIKSDGSLWMWGGNFYGQIGNGFFNTVVYAPVQVGTGYSAVSTGNTHTVALKADGSLWTWGDNTYGQLGRASTAQCTSVPILDCSPTPAQVGTGYVAIAAGAFVTVALKADGSLWAWGANTNGQLGYATTATCGAASTPCSMTPVQVGTGYSGVAAGTGGGTLALKPDGSLWMWSSPSMTNIAPIQVGTAAPTSPLYSAMSLSSYDTLALTANGTLWAWGANSYGELGIGNITFNAANVYTPNQIGGGFSAVAEGPNFSVALKTDGSLWTWGLNNNGQLGYVTAPCALTNFIPPQNVPCAMSPTQLGTGFRVSN